MIKNSSRLKGPGQDPRLAGRLTFLLTVAALGLAIALWAAGAPPKVAKLRPTAPDHPGYSTLPFDKVSLAETRSAVRTANVQIVDFDRDGLNDILVCDAARNAVEGNAVIHPQLTKTFIEEAQAVGDEPKTAPLSKREREILQKVADGATTRQVATELGISPHTVKTHLERIFEKLGANDRAQAVAIAIRTGIVH